MLLTVIYGDKTFKCIQVKLSMPVNSRRHFYFTHAKYEGYKLIDKNMEPFFRADNSTQNFEYLQDVKHFLS